MSFYHAMFLFHLSVNQEKNQLRIACPRKETTKLRTLNEHWSMHENKLKSIKILCVFSVLTFSVDSGDDEVL